MNCALLHGHVYLSVMLALDIRTLDSCHFFTPIVVLRVSKRNHKRQTTGSFYEIHVFAFRIFLLCKINFDSLTSSKDIHINDIKLPFFFVFLHPSLHMLHMHTQ